MHVPQRYLVVTADDFGIGPATSHGILDLAARRRITATVLLVNSPHAEAGVRAWRQAGGLLELGWHPSLTLDRPVLPAAKVPTLVDENGQFFGLGRFIQRLCLGTIARDEIAAELRAQWRRFHDLVGHSPTVVNTHHHIQVFPPVGQLLQDLLACQEELPYLRRVREPWRLLLRVPGARFKRAVLSWWGRSDARRQEQRGFPGNQWLAGVTDPPCLKDPEFLARWLRHLPGQVVELTCHPGYADPTLLGRDATATNGQMERRPDEWNLLFHVHFEEACALAGFQRIAPSQLRAFYPSRQCHAA
jgi:predicted glycoside hydrolase/deacetylase ChbG (UPF0249 family)